jgi:hypothetical protein
MTKKIRKTARTKHATTRHARWPQGFPSGLLVGRAQGFRAPSLYERVAASMTRANRRFTYLRLKAPNFGRLLDAE